uniref:Protein ripply n=1 Tax=Ciona savignyi TaxID=51511 RepID=H2YR42_CIOSA
IRHRNQIRHQELRHQNLHNQELRHHELRHQEFLQINRSTTRQQTKSQKQPGNPPELRHQNRNHDKGSHWSAAVQVSTGFEHFKHPVKLMWPRSKAHDYFYAEGQKLLDGFPVQATIGLYDDTDSEQSDDAYVEQSQLCVAQTPKQVLVQN